MVVCRHGAGSRQAGRKEAWAGGRGGGNGENGSRE